MEQLGLSLAAGALTTLNPCVFPILPLVVGAAVQANRLAPVYMGLGMALSFALLGVLVGLLADSTGLDPEVVREVSAVIMIVFGLSMAIPQAKDLMSRLFSPLADKASGASLGINTSSGLGALGMGMLLGLVWTPCSGPLLASTLAFSASEGAVTAGIILGVFGLGAAIPLVLVGTLSASRLGRVRGWALQHGGRAQQIMGVLLALVGVMVLAGIDKALEAWITQILPESWLQFTTRF